MTSTVNPFQPAVKSQIKARVALDGPTGSGKTWTALKWATVLAGPDGAKRRDDGLARIALIDTERRSASLYAPHFTFDVVNFAPPYEVAQLLATLDAAEAAGYSVCVLDSWSHFWEGEGGVLDEVDAAAKRSGGGNSFAGWKHGTPLQRHMVDVILGLDMHVIVTMRSKMEYVLTEYADKSGKTRTKPEKVGMAPVQRAGVEYEFQIVGDLDLEHRITVSKSRCDVLADRVIQPDRESEAAAEFLTWLDAGEPIADRPSIDALVEQMNAIFDETERATVKHLFVECFGMPNQLRAGQVDEARAWLAERIDGSGDVSQDNTAPAPVDTSENPEPPPQGGRPGSPDGGSGDDSTGDHLATATVAASPDAEGATNPVPSAETNGQKPVCRLCGSTKAGLEEDGEGWRCAIRAACEGRQALAASA